MDMTDDETARTSARLGPEHVNEKRKHKGRLSADADAARVHGGTAAVQGTPLCKEGALLG